MKIQFTARVCAAAIATATLAAMPGVETAALAEHHEEAAPSAAKQALYDLFASSEAAALKRNPFGAFFRGDFTDADKLGDYSAASFEAERAAAEQALAALHAIDRDALSEIDQIAYDTFEYNQQRTLAATEGEVYKTLLALPVDHFRGFHIFYPRLSAPGALMPFDTPQDYANNVSRHTEAAKIIDQSIARFRNGAAEGITLPRVSVEIMIQQLDTQLGAAADNNPYLAPLGAIPDSFTEEEAATARTELTEAVSGTLFPAMQRLRDYLADEYLPQSRESIAATDNPGGEAFYGYRITEMTTLDL
ncbi:MAG: DUF885 domain-containing protein, partial [Erythrobacteraceae bacterium]|nr:DUF885 domain-containing protein [Erythrobacteraceae bacterium]